MFVCNISEKRVNSNSDQLQRRKTRTQQHKDILMHMTTEDRTLQHKDILMHMTTEDRTQQHKDILMHMTTEDRTECETRMTASVLKHDPDI